MIRVEHLTERLWERYTAYLDRRKDARFGHDLAWAQTLQETYGVKIEHIVAIYEGEIVGICPLFLCNPLFGGPHYLTSPFPTYCGPVGNNEEVIKILLRELVNKTSKVDHAEVLTPTAISNAEPDLLPFQESPDYTFRLNLTVNEKDIRNSLRTNFKRILARSEKLRGIEIEVDLTGRLLDEFYRSYARIYGHKHGFIPHVKALFQNIFRYFPEGDARLYMVQVNGKYYGGIFTFWSHREVYYAWSAVEPEKDYQPAHNVIWKIIQDAIREGYDTFNMGEAPRTHETLILFKRGWGTDTVEPMRYFIPGQTKKPSPRLFDRVAWAKSIIAGLPTGILTRLLSPAIRYFL